MFNFEPDWTDGITETLSWKTDILQSTTGAEQRISRRLTPRRTFEFSLLLNGQERAEFENTLFYYGAKTWLLPIYNDVLMLNENAQAGGFELRFDSKNSSLKSNDALYIVASYDDTAFSETVTINSIKADCVVLGAPLTHSYNKGVRVFQVKKAVLTDPPSITRINASLYSVQVRFRICDDSPFNDDVSKLNYYRGFPALALSPSWTDPLTSQYDRLITELDNETGIPYRLDTALRPFYLHSFNYDAIGRKEQNELRTLFYYLRGRQRVIWTQSNNSDLTVKSNITNGVFTIAKIGLSEYGIGAGRRDVAVALRSGQMIYARITQVASLNDGLERIALDFGLNAKKSDVLTISFLTLSRLDADDVAWHHLTDSDGLASVSINFKGVRDELESV